MTPEQMKGVEAAMQLRDLKAGDVITPRQMAAIEHLLGGLLATARNMKPGKMTIDFTSGEPKLTENTLGVGVSVNGKDLS